MTSCSLASHPIERSRQLSWSNLVSDAVSNKRRIIRKLYHASSLPAFPGLPSIAVFGGSDVEGVIASVSKLEFGAVADRGRGSLIVKPVAEQLALIRRGAEQITPEDELVKKLERSLKTNKPLRVKYGIDPTGIDVHLGHTVPLRKLRLFQELGHQAVLIIGNYTALVGDPSGRDQTRARLTPEQVEANARDYLKQVSKVIDITKTEVTRNGDWFGKMRFR